MPKGVAVRVRSRAWQYRRASGTPDTVDEGQLRELHIRTVVPAEDGERAKRAEQAP